MNSATPTSIAEPFESVAPRLIACMEAVIASLQSHGVTVETGESFLLDCTTCPFQTPRVLDGFPVQMGFAGSVPLWDDRVRYHLHVCFLGSARRWSVYETPRGFNIQRIVSRILDKLEEHKRARAEREQKANNQRLAEERLTELSTTLGLVHESALQLSQDNVRIEGLPETPGKVRITVTTSHANAEKIAREFRVLARAKKA